MKLSEYAVNVSRPRFNTLLGALASRGLLGCLLSKYLDGVLAILNAEYGVNERRTKE